MPMKMVWLASVLLCVSWSSVSGQNITALRSNRHMSLMEHTLDTLQAINSRLLSMETHQQTIASRLESIENRQQSTESRLEAIESHVFNATAPPTNTLGNYTGNGCVSGRLLERAVMAIQKKKTESADEEESNDDIAAREAGGEDADHTGTSLGSLLRLLSLLRKDDDDDDEEATSSHVKRFDVVIVESDKSRAMRLQEGHGGWVSPMSAVLGKKGFVREIDGDGDAHVEFVNKIKWYFNPALLTVVNTTNMTIDKGDFVFVNESYERVKSLQDSEHGGWAESMRETLGEGGIVTKVDRNGRAWVKVGSTSWIYNKLALTLVAKSGEM